MKCIRYWTHCWKQEILATKFHCLAGISMHQSAIDRLVMMLFILDNVAWDKGMNVARLWYIAFWNMGCKFSIDYAMFHFFFFFRAFLTAARSPQFLRIPLGSEWEPAWLRRANQPEHFAQGGPSAGWGCATHCRAEWKRLRSAARSSAMPTTCAPSRPG